jgi:hypothetical protein
LEHHRKIEPAVHESQRWLQQAVTKLDAFIAAPNQSANAGTRTALQRHFHTTDVNIVRRVRNRLETIRTDMLSRDPFTTECHTDADSTCKTSGAYVPGTNRSMIVFCPNFFAGSDGFRVKTMIHEMAHTLLGGPHITDRGYSSDRVLPYLSTAEALTNAESYAFLAQELGTGVEPQTNAAVDEIDEDCGPQVTEFAKRAIARAQRWNRDAETVAGDKGNLGDDLLETHFGSKTAETRAAALDFYRKMVERLHTPIEVQCDKKARSNRKAYGLTERNRTGTGAMIGSIVGGVLGAAAGGIIGGFVGGLGGGVLGGFLGAALGGLVGAGIGAAIGYAASSSAKVVLSPSWKDQGDENDRVETVLTAIYEAYAGADTIKSQQYAEFARAAHQRWFSVPAI